MLTNFDHDRQWFNTLIPPSHESAAVTVACWLYFTLEWTRGVITTLYHARLPCRDRRYGWDGGISVWDSMGFIMAMECACLCQLVAGIGGFGKKSAVCMWSITAHAKFTSCPKKIAQCVRHSIIVPWWLYMLSLSLHFAFLKCPRKTRQIWGAVVSSITVKYW